MMRKNTKSVLAVMLKSMVSDQLKIPENSQFIIDGGHLLHSVTWPCDATYREVCDTYVTHVLIHYGRGSALIFDGYDFTLSTKALEQHRRAVQNASAEIIFEVDMVLTTSQTSFLANSKNKQRLTIYSRQNLSLMV